MELVYLWVEEYKNIHRQGFNFSPRFECKFKAVYKKDQNGNEILDEEKSKLIICDKKDPNGKAKEECKKYCDEPFIENFFGDNINVTAIVGKNGSGKSSILEMLLSRICTANLLIFVKDNKFYIQHSFFKINSNKNLIFLDNSFIDDNYIDSCTNIYTMGYITFDLFKEKKIDDNNKNIDNNLRLENNFLDECLYSYENLFFNLLKDDSSRMKLDIEYQKKSIHKKLFNILDRDVLFTTFKPKKIIFKIQGLLLNNTEQFNVPEIYKNVKDWNDRYYNIKALNTYAKKFYLDKTKFDIEEMLYLYNIMKYLSQAQEEAYTWLKTFKFNFLQTRNKELDFKNELKDIHQLLFSGKARYPLNLNKNLKDDFFKLNTNEEGYFSSFSEENLIYLEKFFNNQHEQKFKIKDSFEKISLLLELYEIGFLNIDFLDDKNRTIDNLSHGERSFFIVEFLIVNKILEIKEENLFFLLDEIHANFHPQWQKNILNRLKKLLIQFDKKIHIILTTHSPFLLSDIPKQNIIFLDTYKKEDEEVKNGKQKVGNCKVVDGLNEKKETFGANIHTLLSDSFFMEDGLMGEFAKGKIESIKKFYNKVIKYKDNDKVKKDYKCFYEKKQKEFWDIQSIIGEPFLQKIVKNQLEEIELILFEEKAQEIQIQRYIEEFGADKIREVLDNAQN